MESALSTIPFSSISKTLKLHFPIPKSPMFSPITSLSYPSPMSIGSASSIHKRFRRHLKCLGSSAGGGDSEAKGGLGAEDDLSSDAIILNVGGMSCGGCVSSVKKILESQLQVSSASVDLTTATAFVLPVLEAKALPNWKKELGEALAKHLTSCGFQSKLRVAGDEAFEGGVSP